MSLALARLRAALLAGDKDAQEHLEDVLIGPSIKRPRALRLYSSVRVFVLGLELELKS